MCCGGKRAAARAAAMSAAVARPVRATPHAPRSDASEIVFEYIGHGPGRIQGPVSGQIYRFAGPGARVRVDARDRPGLAALSVVRWVK